MMLNLGQHLEKVSGDADIRAWRTAYISRTQGNLTKNVGAAKLFPLSGIRESFGSESHFHHRRVTVDSRV